MRKTRNWKHNTKETKQYGKRNMERYLIGEEDEEDVQN